MCRDSSGTQAGPTDLRHAHPRAGVHRPGAGLLRGALPPACLAQARPEGQGHGHAARTIRQPRLKTPEKSISYLVFLERRCQASPHRVAWRRALEETRQKAGATWNFHHPFSSRAASQPQRRARSTSETPNSSIAYTSEDSQPSMRFPPKQALQPRGTCHELHRSTA